MKLARALSHILMAVGLLTVTWAFLAWRWQDPITGLYTWHQQRELAQQLHARPISVDRRSIAAIARLYRLASHDREAMGRITIPRIGLNAVLVEGTDAADLEQGPGIYAGDYLPGERRLVYIAGHRTTFGAPFSDLDRLRPGDAISIAMPYGTFAYTVTGHRIVPANDIPVLRSHHYEQLILQTCQPRFSATQRYLVYATPTASAGSLATGRTTTSQATLAERSLGAGLRRSNAVFR